MTDWRLVLGRLRPVSAYHWKGDGMNDSYASIGEWRDAQTEKPTEQECLDEWDVYVLERDATEAEEAAAAAARAQVLDSFANNHLHGMTPDQIEEYVTNEINSWTSLANARTGLLKLLPIMAQILSWLVIDQE